MGSSPSQSRLTPEGARGRLSRSLPSGSREHATQRAAGRLLFGSIGAAVAGLVIAGAPLCPSAGWLGIPCPGCGLTRAALRLAAGDLAGALQLHPLVPVAAPALLWLAWGAARAWWIPEDSSARLVPLRPSPWERAGTAGAALLTAALLAVWGLRFFGFFGGPAPVTTYGEWWRGATSTEQRREEPSTAVPRPTVPSPTVESPSEFTR